MILAGIFLQILGYTFAYEARHEVNMIRRLLRYTDSLRILMMIYVVRVDLGGDDLQHFSLMLDSVSF